MGDSAVSMPADRMLWLRRWLIRIAMLASAIFLALIVSGAIFQVIPGFTIAHTNGVSMVPHFRSGDVIVIHVEHPKQVHVGQIVLFEEDVPVTHRVISVGPDRGPNTVITTKGDNNATEDQSIKLGAVQGIVVGKLPLLGEASRWLHAGGGFYVYHYFALSLNLLFILVFAAFETRKLNRHTNSTAG